MTKQDIIECASKLFSRYGIKAVNMDDIAAKLGVSKRTLYESFKGKQELIVASVDKTKSVLDVELERIKNIKDPVAALEAIFRHCIDTYTRFYEISSSFYRDIKSYSDAFDIIENSIKNMQQTTKVIYHRGVEAGLLNNCADFDLLAQMWDCYNRNNMYEEHSKRVTPESFARILKIFILSLSTEQGRRSIEIIKG